MYTSTATLLFYTLYCVLFVFVFNWLKNPELVFSCIVSIDYYGKFFFIFLLFQKFFEFQIFFFIGKEFLLILFDEIRN